MAPATQERLYCVYILSNARNTVLYTGVTNDLVRRVWEHQQRESRTFTSRYNVTKLVYYEAFAEPGEAIAREKQIKAGSRAKKIALVESVNPQWRDLWPDIRA